MLRPAACTIGGRSSSEWITHQIDRLRYLDDTTKSLRSGIYSIYKLLIDVVDENGLGDELDSIVFGNYQNTYIMSKLKKEIESYCAAEYIEAYLEEDSSPGTINERLRLLGQKFCEDYAKRVLRDIVNNGGHIRSITSIPCL